jgi:hypothetical protein
MRTLLHLLLVFLGIALLMWLLPPREIETHIKYQGRVEAQEAAPHAAERRPTHWSVICPVAPPCWRDGKPISGSL